MFRIVVNGKKIQVPKSSTILQALKLAKVTVPILCYNGRFKPKASCRLCLVETNSSLKPVPSCNTFVKEGDVITTDSPKLEQYRNCQLELLLGRHPNECLTCLVSGHCTLQDLIHERNIHDKWPKHIRGEKSKHPTKDFTSPCISRDLRKCIECGLCADACGPEGQDINAIGFAERGGNMLPVTVFDVLLKDTPCIDCGQCTSVCPVGALTEHSDWQRVLHELNSKRKLLIVQTAPATRVAIGEEFGLEPGSISTGKLITSLRVLGFDLVFDTNFAADLTIMEEGSELLDRVQNNKLLPLMTSCCPGWINYVEKSHPELIPYLSTSKSPQQMHGAVTRKLYGNDCFIVSIMPCTAKKGEMLRPASTIYSNLVRNDVDAVLTTRELAEEFWKQLYEQHLNYQDLHYQM
jgi:NADH-quinone oxidoreductase subunit G